MSLKPIYLVETKDLKFEDIQGISGFLEYGFNMLSQHRKYYSPTLDSFLIEEDYQELLPSNRVIELLDIEKFRLYKCLGGFDGFPWDRT